MCSRKGWGGSMVDPVGESYHRRFDRFVTGIVDGPHKRTDRSVFVDNATDHAPEPRKSMPVGPPVFEPLENSFGMMFKEIERECRRRSVDAGEHVFGTPPDLRRCSVGERGYHKSCDLAITRIGETVDDSDRVRFTVRIVVKSREPVEGRFQ